MERNNQNGSYCITEQGDLGLGTTPISKDYVDENGNKFWSGNKLYPTAIEWNETVGANARSDWLEFPPCRLRSVRRHPSRRITGHSRGTRGRGSPARDRVCTTECSDV